MKFMLALVLAVALLPAACHAYNNGPLVAKPPMGWSSWCTDDICGIIDKCTENEVLTTADAMLHNGMKDLGYDWIVLDDCWAATSRNSTGHLQPDAKQFPNGMAALATKLHGMGFKLGLYTCIGTETCHGKRPGSFGHYELDAQTFAAWGVDQVKADNCHKPSGYTEQQLYHNFSVALNATGRPIWFALCEWGEENVLAWGAQEGQSFRVQQDHLPLWWAPDTGAGQGTGGGVLNIIEYMAGIQPSTHIRRWGWLDVDFLETFENPITMDETNSRTEFSFWSLWSAPLLVSTDLRNMTAVKKAMVANPEVLAVNQDPLWTAGDRVANYTDRGEVWSKPLSTGAAAVILFNPSERSITVPVTWSQLSLPDQPHVVRDLWNRADIGAFSSGYNATLDKHAVFFFTATAAKA